MIHHLLQIVFKMYDTTGTGKLQAFVLREALASAGYQLNNHIVNALGHRYGTRDGSISFDDFITASVKVKTMIGEILILICEKQHTMLLN